MNALLRRSAAGLSALSRRARLRAGPWLLSAACLSLGAGASVSFERDTQSSGTFTSTGWSFTLFSVDLPKSAINTARENASDANLPHLVVEEMLVTPYLGPLDFLMEFFSFRYARIRGTWGFAGE
jgi:hypothetical protein